ncbi:MAG: Phosphoglycerate mutase (2,3-diphosphoglycerate-independent) [Candidatus Berkelbacteria bacterium]|nr:Phosphoglycerate mutase (2,3-diphosphoglycerate-independent) [Candidatus Berkelbacteria bacterium]
MSPSWAGNAIAMYNPPNISGYWREYPHKVLKSYDQERAQYSTISDSRYAHTSISAGRIIPQDMDVINRSIKDNSFYKNRVLIDCFNYARDNNSNIHFVGLISDVGLHGHVDHILALIEMAYRQNFSRIYVDCITDGIDTEPREANKFIQKIQRKFDETGIGKFSSITGRNWSMIKNNPKNLLPFYNMIFEGKGEKSDSVTDAINRYYEKGLTDDEILPTLIHIKDGYQMIKAFDVVLFSNYRSQAVRSLARIFNGQTSRVNLPAGMLFVSMTKYSQSFNNPVVFDRATISDLLPSVLAKYMKTNLRVTESIKKHHLTYFFNGGRKEPLGGEQRVILETPKVKSFDQNPRLAGDQITQQVISGIKSNAYDLIVCNFPNADSVAHTNNIRAAGKAVLALDEFVKKIVDANLSAGGATIITADHGNIEQMSINRQVRQTKTIHTLNPVPFILITKDRRKNLIQGALSIPYSTLSKIVTAKNTLADIAPTILELMGLPKPEVMTGHSLLRDLE